MSYYKTELKREEPEHEDMKGISVASVYRERLAE